jgi:hypothetical protein
MFLRRGLAVRVQSHSSRIAVPVQSHLQQVQREFAERFLQHLLTNKDIKAEDARQSALKELPALVKLPLAEIQSLIDRKIAPRATEKSFSFLDRACAALAEGNYDDVFQAAGGEKQQGRELATLEGTAALARFRQSPRPEWNLRALAAFQRAMALADPNSSTDRFLMEACREVATYQGFSIREVSCNSIRACGDAHVVGYNHSEFSRHVPLCCALSLSVIDRPVGK